MKNICFNKKLASIISISIGTIVFITLLLFQLTMIDKQKQNKRIETTEKYVYFQKDISNIIYSNINLLDGYIAFLSIEKDVSKEDTTRFLNELLKDKVDYIRNITVLEDTTIVLAYPSTGNDTFVGVDLGKVASQRENVLKVKQSLKPLFQGPVKLVQGGTGFIIRVPVEKQGKYWGQVSIVMNADNFMKMIKSFEKDLNIQVAIVNLDSERASQIYGDKSLINDNYSKFNFNIELLNWMIYIKPNHSQTDSIYYNIIIFIFILLFSTSTGILTWVYQRRSAKIKYHASYDNLTGLYNRNYSVQYVTKVFEDAKRRNYKLGVTILDINKFKSINDNFGHNIGDLVLKDFAGQLKSTLRDGEKVFRIGGDEFMILFENIKNEDSLKITEKRIKESLSYSKIINDNNISISASIGSAIFPNDGDNIETVINAADKKMYEDKVKS